MAPPDVAGGHDLAPVRERYLAALLAPDSRAAWELASAAANDGAGAGAVYLEVLAPAMRQIGELWETARISVAQEHLATQITQSVLARLAPALGDSATGGRGRLALVAGTPGELHALGARMVADFLESDGWEVLVPGPDTPAHDLVGLATEHRPAVVALSTALPGNLLAAGRVCALLGRLDPAPLVVVGGRAYGGDAQRARAVGADAFADDPRRLLGLLATRVPS